MFKKNPNKRDGAEWPLMSECLEDRAEKFMNKKKPNKRDKCVSCKTETEYDEFDHIDSRNFYVEGAGQLCVDCWNKIYEQKIAK